MEEDALREDEMFLPEADDAGPVRLGHNTATTDVDGRGATILSTWDTLNTPFRQECVELGTSST